MKTYEEAQELFNRYTEGCSIAREELLIESIKQKDIKYNENEHSCFVTIYLGNNPDFIFKTIRVLSKKKYETNLNSTINLK